MNERPKPPWSRRKGIEISNDGGLTWSPISDAQFSQVLASWQLERPAIDELYHQLRAGEVVRSPVVVRFIYRSTEAGQHELFQEPDEGAPCLDPQPS